MKKILLFDIEATNLSANFGYMICFGYKWLGEDKTHVISITDFPKTFKQNCTNDKKLLEAIGPILNEADMFVTWYGTHFDIPFIHTRQLLHKLKPFADRPHRDDWKIARKRLKFTSNRLDTVSKSLPLTEGETKKEKTPLENKHWIRGAAGHKPSIEYIKKHCIADVDVLEEAHIQLSPFGSAVPNLNLKDDANTIACPACNSKKVEYKHLYATSNNLRYQYRCKVCGHWYFVRPTAHKKSQANK